MVRGSLYCYAPAGARKQTSNTNGDAVKKNTMVTHTQLAYSITCLGYVFVSQAF